MVFTKFRMEYRYYILNQKQTINMTRVTKYAAGKTQKAQSNS